MSRLAPVAALAALLAVVAVAPAADAGHGACAPLVADGLDDAKATPPALRPYAGDKAAGADRALDLRSADVVTDGKRITAVIRVKHLDEPAADTSIGRIWRVYFTVPTNEQRYWLEAIQAANGVDGWVGRYNLPSEAGSDDMVAGRYAYASAKLDLDRGEIRISAPLKVFDKFARIKPRMPMYDFELASFKYYGKASTDREDPVGRTSWGPTGHEHVADTSRSERTYRAGSRGCIKP